MQEGKVSYWNFIVTAPMLRGQRDVRDECVRGVRIQTRDDQNGAGLAANPRSASQMSPGFAFIERIEDFLRDSPRRLQIQGVGVGQLNHVGNDLLHLSRQRSRASLNLPLSPN